MRSVLHISDPHFGTEQLPVVRALHALIADLAPEAVLIGGDVTQRARRSQFARAADFVQALGVPSLCIPGNHDIPLYNLLARVFYPYRNYRQAMGEDLEPVFENDAFLVVGVNSTHPRRHKDGEVSRAQIRRVANRLAAGKPAQLKIVMAHHPVRAMEESDRVNLLHGRQLALPRWIEAGMHIMLGGHIHLPYSMPLLPAATEGPQAWVVQAGTALSHRVRGNVPNSVNLIGRESTSLDGCFTERWDFDSGSGRFRPIRRQPLVFDTDQDRAHV